MATQENRQFVVCIENRGYEASLERRKIYVVVAQAEGPDHGLLRVIDESGEDYLYPKELFQVIDLPRALGRAILAAA